MLDGVISTVATSTKAIVSATADMTILAKLTNLTAAIFGLSINWIVTHLNPALLVVTPLLTFIMVITLGRLHYINSKKATLEIKKLKKELNNSE